MANREHMLLSVSDVLDHGREKIIGMLTSETGCGRHYATVQVDFTVSLLRQAAGLPYTAVGQVLPSDNPGTRALAVRQPVGVVAAIAPWNAPWSVPAAASWAPSPSGTRSC
ncbi:aldehyde dehydrogenase family protein [Streptomyces sp. NBC_01142]|nr:aldehyde dehydrogenase family protein [Streptomyces sp. NBC_01142]